MNNNINNMSSNKNALEELIKFCESKNLTDIA